MKLINARGTKDFAPVEKIPRQKVVDTLKNTFELYGFSPLETPIIERTDVLAAKYAGGAEILKETFQLKDQGKRDLCLRYDLTVPLARFIGMNPTTKMPFKRYAIGRVFRDGPIKAGRCREFWQCDVDIVGSKSMMADAQCIQIAQKFFKSINLEVNIELNSRKILDAMMESANIPEEKRMPVILEIDKLKKTSLESVQSEIEKQGISAEQIKSLSKVLTVSGNNQDKLDQLKPLLTSESGISGLEEVEEILKYTDENVVSFTPTLARGLSYYTGPIFEVFLKDKYIMSSALCAGGRWDNMIGDFLQTKKAFPAVGISFGLEPITTVLNKLYENENNPKTVTQLYIIPINTQEESMKIADRLRNQNIKTDLDIAGKGISKNLDYANKLGIPFVLFVGEDELKNNKFKIKNMISGNDSEVSIEDIPGYINE